MILVVAITPFALVGMAALFSMWSLSSSAEQQLEDSREDFTGDIAGRAVQADAVMVVRDVGGVLSERIDDVVTLASSPSLLSAARRAGNQVDSETADPASDLESRFANERRLLAGSPIDRYLTRVTRDQPLFLELSFTERTGLTVAASEPPNSLAQGDQEWWRQAWDNGLYIGEIARGDGSDAVQLTIAARMDAANGAPRGVVRGVVALDGVQQIAARVARQAGADVTVMTNDGALLAETASDNDATRLVTPGVSLGGPRDEAFRQALDGVDAGFTVSNNDVVGFASLAARSPFERLARRYEAADFGAVEWVAVVEQSDGAALPAIAGLNDVQDRLSDTVRSFAILLLVILLVAVAVVYYVSSMLADRIVGPLRSLRSTARIIADQQLPALVQQAQSGEDDLPALRPVQLSTGDEIEEVADAFNVVTTTAADLAAEQARRRRDVARMFVSLGRRNQNLLSRQLELIDRLERDTSDPDLLDDLFRLDHLATRMRRNAESLLVLAGEQPSRRWSEPVPVTTVVRGAISEIEDYRRVVLDQVDEVKLSGAAVGDVTHLLAELIENAAQFSPPDSKVVVVGRRVADGYALAVVDEGVGMSAEQIADANSRIGASPLVDRVPSSFLGLFVVGQLASRHSIEVRLLESTTEGVTAKVLLPNALIDAPDAEAEAPAPAVHGGQRSQLTAGRNAQHSDAKDSPGDVDATDGADASPVVIDVTEDATQRDGERPDGERPDVERREPARAAAFTTSFGAPPPPAVARSQSDSSEDGRVAGSPVHARDGAGRNGGIASERPGSAAFTGAPFDRLDTAADAVPATQARDATTSTPPPPPPSSSPPPPFAQRPSATMPPTGDEHASDVEEAAAAEAVDAEAPKPEADGPVAGTPPHPLGASPAAAHSSDAVAEQSATAETSDTDDADEDVPRPVLQVRRRASLRDHDGSHQNGSQPPPGTALLRIEGAPETAADDADAADGAAAHGGAAADADTTQSIELRDLDTPADDGVDHAGQSASVAADAATGADGAAEGGDSAGDGDAEPEVVRSNGAAPDDDASGSTPPAPTSVTMARTPDRGSAVDDGVVLSPAEREARAARQRLASFQRAVQRGRSRTGNK